MFGRRPPIFLAFDVLGVRALPLAQREAVHALERASPRMLVGHPQLDLIREGTPQSLSIQHHLKPARLKFVLLALH